MGRELKIYLDKWVKTHFSVSIAPDSLEQTYKNNPEQKKILNESFQGERLAKTGMSLAKGIK